MRKLTFLTIALLTFLIPGCASEELTSARLYIQQKNWVKAEEFLLKALEVEPENQEVLYSLGKFIYAKNEDWENMNKMFDQALSINPEGVILLGGTVREYVEQTRYEHWSKIFNKGVSSVKKYYEQDQKDGEITLKESINLFETAVQIYPSEIKNYPILSRCYFEMGDSLKSITTVNKGVEISPDNFDINLTAGQIINNMNNKQGALPFLKHAVELEPHNSAAIQLLAQVYYDLGNQREAIETYKIAINEEGDKKVKADLYFNLGVIYNQMSDFDAAEMAFDEAYYLNDQDFEAVLGMARAYEGLGDKYKDGTDGFEEDLTEAARWYRKAGRKIKDAMTIDFENEEKYSRQLELIQYKKNIVEGEQE